MTARLLQLFFLTLPFQFALSPLEGVDLHISRLFAIAIFFVWLFEGFFRKRLLLSVNIPSFLLISFLFLAVFSSLWANELGWSVRKSAFLLSFFPLLLVIQGVFIQEGMEGARRIFSSSVIGAALASVVSIFQSLSQLIFGFSAVFSFWVGHIFPFFLGTTFAASVAEYPSLLANIGGMTVFRATAFFPDPHIFSYFMGMTFPFAYALSREAKSRHQRIFFLAASVSLFIADLLAFSRGGYAGLLFGAVIAVFVFKKKIFLPSRKKATVIIIGIALLGVLLLPNPVHDRLVSSFSLEDGSNAGRIALWREGMEFLVERPILGYGLGNYPIVVKPSADYREPIYAHNLFLDISLDLGLLGGLMFLGGIIGVFLALFRRKDVFSGAALISLSIFFAHSLFETPLYSVHILPLFLLVFSVIAIKGVELKYD